ncbi:MAG: 4Fe-4S double cluster binding domain-containing protein [Anaerolineae bacterium]|jgi:epoxyqueuosine reductase
MSEELLAQLTKWGYQARIVSIKHLADLQRQIEGQVEQGLIDEELRQTYLAGFTFEPPSSLPGARSILVVAVPEPRIGVSFTWNGKRLRTTIPPTYNERKKTRRIRERLAQAFESAGYRMAEAILPKKLLAVCSGLAAYGRNNITYVPGMGSFHGLVAVYSDLPAPDDGWRQPEMMENCRNCSACRRHCPAGAISAERFLLHAERCITFHNEKPADVPFPAWIEPAWHNCLIGCLHCQRVCPENREVWSWVEEGAEFSAEETALLLAGTPFEQLPAGTADKLERLDLEPFVELLPRNLTILLEQRQ